MRNQIFRLCVFVILAGVVVALPNMRASASADIVVTNGNDSGAGSLRQAVADASSGDTIAIDPSVGTVSFLQASGGLVINKDLTIYASNTTITGTNIGTMIEVQSSANLTLYNAKVIGGGVGIDVFGTLTLYNCTVSNGVDGVYVESTGVATIMFSTFVNGTDHNLRNFGTTSVFNTLFSGGGVSVDQTGGTMVMNNSTVTGAVNNGISVGNNGLSLDHVTLANTGGNGLSNSSYSVRVSDSLFTNNATNCVDAVIDMGGNVEQGTTSTCGVTLDNNPQINTTLADNGGPTQTHVLQATGMADSLVSNCAAMLADQRSTMRPGTNCDAGAYDNGTATFTAQPALSFQNTSIDEAGTATANLVLNFPAGVQIVEPVYVTLRELGSSVINGTRNGAITSSVKFECNPTTPCVNGATIAILAPVDDSTQDGDDTFDLLIESVAGAAVYSPMTQTITVVDTDGAAVTPGYAINNLPSSVSEDAGSFAYDVQLSSVPTGTVEISATGTAGVCTVNGSITLDASNYNDAANDFTVTVLDDTAVDGDQTCTITYALGAGTTATEYSMFGAPGASTVTVTDDDTANSGGSSGGTSGGTTGTTTTVPSSGSVWSIDITADAPFSLPGASLNLTITVAKLSGGTPVTVSLPLPAGFIPGTPSSTRGNVVLDGQTVTFTDDIHAGESAVITVPVTIDPTIGTPFHLTAQSCITSPVSLCETVVVSSVNSLPMTGEEPAWAVAIRDLMQAANIDAAQASAGITLEDLGMTVDELEALGITVDDLSAIGVNIIAEA